MMPFLSPQLKSLEFEAEVLSTLVDDLLHAAATRIPNLQSFTLKTRGRANSIKDSLRRAVGSWTNLRVLRLPPYFLIPSVMEVVVSHPNLVAVEQDYSYNPWYDTAGVLQDIPQHASPKLKSFSFNSNPAFGCKLIQSHPELFARLMKIHLNAYCGVTDPDVQAFTRHLGERCPKLRQIALDLCVAPEYRTEDVAPLSIGVMENLFPCRSLERLEIGHPFPITITDSDVERMGTAWPNLVGFGIGFEPDPSLPIPDDAGNSLSILSAFAKHLPMMKELGLCFASSTPVAFDGDLYPEDQLWNLETLVVGLSAVPGEKSHETAFFIASLCAQLPIIHVGPSVWFLRRDEPEWERHRSRWEGVQEILELVMKTKTTSLANMLRGGGVQP